jgi:hypothetical protein
MNKTSEKQPFAGCDARRIVTLQSKQIRRAEGDSEFVE